LKKPTPRAFECAAKPNIIVEKSTPAALSTFSFVTAENLQSTYPPSLI